MNMKKLLRGPFVWVAVVLLLAYLGAQMLSGDAPAEIDTSEGLELLRGETVEQAEVNDTTQRVELALSEDFEDVGDLVAFYYAVPQGETVMEAISASDPEQGYNTEVPQPSVWASVLGFLLPMLIILAIFWFLLSRMQGGGGMMKFGKSKAKLVSKETPQVTFADVAGADEAVEELQEIRERHLRHVLAHGEERAAGQVVCRSFKGDLPAATRNAVGMELPVDGLREGSPDFRLAVSISPVRREFLVAFAAALGAGAMTGCEGGCLIEKEQLRVAPRRHDRPLSALEGEGTGDPVPMRVGP